MDKGMHEWLRPATRSFMSSVSSSARADIYSVITAGGHVKLNASLARRWHHTDVDNSHAGNEGGTDKELINCRKSEKKKNKKMKCSYLSRFASSMPRPRWDEIPIQNFRMWKLLGRIVKSKNSCGCFFTQFYYHDIKKTSFTSHLMPFYHKMCSLPF